MFTPLGALQNEAKKAWLKSAVKPFRQRSELAKYMTAGENSVIQTINELTPTSKGSVARIGLVADLNGTGVVGDNQLEGREEAMDAMWVEIEIDQLRNGTVSKGRMDDQKSVFDFRSQARDKLGYWRARIFDELLISTASGISYSLNMDGSPRLYSNQDQLSSLKFANYVTPPSSGRHFIVDSSGNFVNGDQSGITTASVLSYKVMVALKAEAITRGIKPIIAGGREFHLFLCHPKALAQLKTDKDYLASVQNGAERGMDNPIFTGASVTVDGLVIAHSMRVFNTTGAAQGAKWGNAGAVNGTRSLLLGAQALAVADLWENGDWDEETRDMGNKAAIAMSMMFGILKPSFKSFFDGNTTQDFGVMVLDHYIA
jgi:N4-gp56 family major capsid protein